MVWENEQTNCLTLIAGNIFEQEISILWFLKDLASIKTGVIILKIQLCHHRSKLNLKICSYRKAFSDNSQYYCCTVFLIKQIWPCWAYQAYFKNSYQPQRRYSPFLLLNHLHLLFLNSLLCTCWHCGKGEFACIINIWFQSVLTNNMILLKLWTIINYRWHLF